MLKDIKRMLTLLDNYMFAHVHPYVNEANTSIMVFISMLASHQFLLPVNILLAAYFFFIEKDNLKGIKVVVVELGGTVLLFSLKYYFRRVRPDHPVHEAASGYSFPSGHSMSAVTFYGLIIYLFVSSVKDRRTRAFMILFFSLLILAIGFSRIYLRVHYASDVLGGFAGGIIWLTASLCALNALEKKWYEKKV